MTAQPTTPISAPTAVQDPTAMPAWGAPAGSYPEPFAAGGYPSPYGTTPAPAAGRSVGRIVSIVCSLVVVLAGIATAALFLFGPRTVDPQSVQQEIVRITRTDVGVVPTDVRCPDKVTAAAGGTFTCTGTVDGQPVTYGVRQDDDKGRLTVTYDRLVKMGDITNAVAGQVGKDVGVDVRIACEPAGRTVVVDKPGTPIACTATNASDTTDSAKINVTLDAAGIPSYTFA